MAHFGIDVTAGRLLRHGCRLLIYSAMLYREADVGENANMHFHAEFNTVLMQC